MKERIEKLIYYYERRKEWIEKEIKKINISKEKFNNLIIEKIEIENFIDELIDIIG